MNLVNDIWEFFEFDKRYTPVNDESIKVSVFCNTYNHAQFIEDALKGFIEQRTNFPYEVIIFDDASTDGTKEIIGRYAEKHPEILKFFSARKNTWGLKNRAEFMRRFRHYVAKGKYYAFCEGDDLWIDRNKLQIQIDYMESHTNCVLTMHNSVRVDFSNNCSFQVFDDIDDDVDLSLEDIVFYRSRMETSSMIIRAEKYEMDDIFYNNGTGDWMLQIWCALNGTVHYIDRVMSIYRFRTPGSWSSSNLMDHRDYVLHTLRMINFFSKLYKYTSHNYEELLIDREQLLFQNIALGFKGVQEDEMTDRLTYALSKAPELSYYVNEFKRVHWLKKYESIYEQSDFIDTIGHFKHRVIWGIGVGGKKLSIAMNKRKIQIDGYAVADIEPSGSFQEKPVWKLSNLPFKKGEVLVLVGIFSIPWKELKEMIDESGVENYIFPYLYHSWMGKSLISNC